MGRGKQQAWGPEMGKRGPWKTERLVSHWEVFKEATIQGRAGLMSWHVRKGDQEEGGTHRFRESQEAGWRCRAGLHARVRPGGTRLPSPTSPGGALDAEGDRLKGGCRPPVPSTGLGWGLLVHRSCLAPV